MAFYIRRIFRGIMTLFIIVTIVFFATRLTGDPLMWLLPDDAPMEAMELLSARLGLDRPYHEQYIRYLQSAFRGDFGNSFLYRRSVTALFMERIPRSLWLMAYSLAFGIIFGIPVGILAALNRNKPLDRFLMTSSFLAYAVPNFVLGIFLILFFSLFLRWLPSGGYGGWRYLIMPVFTFGASSAGLIARLMRSSMLDVVRKDFIRTAHAKGLSRRTVIIKHALRIAVLPVITVVGLQIPRLIAGSFVIETIFSWPGAGRLVIQAARTRDFPVLQFAVLITAVCVVVANTLVDISYSLLDPRIKYE